jgi:hypothetical protein
MEFTANVSSNIVGKTLVCNSKEVGEKMVMENGFLLDKEIHLVGLAGRHRYRHLRY